MPQPLSAYLGKSDNWSISFDPDELQKHADLAAKVAEAIARASSIDHGLAMILVQVLHASPQPAFAMFSEVMDAGNRRSMILAAARAQLADDDFASLEAIVSVAKLQIDVRNRFAHWLWGRCEQVNDALLLADPRYLLGHARHAQQTWSAPYAQRLDVEHHQKMVDALKYEFDKIYVYKSADFDRILKDFQETQRIIGIFISILNPLVLQLDEDLRSHMPDHKSLIEQARHQLSSQRLFVEALQRLRSKRQRRTEAPPPQHQRPDPE